jgi:hypothetical protein
MLSRVISSGCCTFQTVQRVPVHSTAPSTSSLLTMNPFEAYLHHKGQEYQLHDAMTFPGKLQDQVASQ